MSAVEPEVLDVPERPAAPDDAPSARVRSVPSWVAPTVVGVLALVLGVYVQLAFAIDGRVLGAVADLSMIAIVAIALRCGPIGGAGAGFAAGILFDLALQMPLGSSSLVLTPIGWAAGAFAASRRRVTLGMAVLVLAVAAAARAIGDALVAAAVDGQSIAWAALGVTGLTATMFTVLFGIALLPLLRRVLGVPERRVL